VALLNVHIHISAKEPWISAKEPYSIYMSSAKEPSPVRFCGPVECICMNFRKRAVYFRKRALFNVHISAVSSTVMWRQHSRILQRKDIVHDMTYSTKHKRALYICKRALETRKSALYIRKRALHIRQRALHIRKKALNMCKRALHIRKTALHIFAKEPYIFTKEPYISVKEPLKRAKTALSCTSM